MTDQKHTKEDKCFECGVLITEHMGLRGTCNELQFLKKRFHFILDLERRAEILRTNGKCCNVFDLVLVNLDAVTKQRDKLRDALEYWLPDLEPLSLATDYLR